MAPHEITLLLRCYTHRRPFEDLAAPLPPMEAATLQGFIIAGYLEDAGNGQFPPTDKGQEVVARLLAVPAAAWPWPESKNGPTYLTLSVLREHVAVYLASLNNDNQEELYQTDRESAEYGTDGLLAHLEEVAKVNPEFVDMDAVRYRVAVETMVAVSNERPLTVTQQRLFDALRGRPNAPFDVAEFSGWIDEAMKEPA